MPEPAIAFLPYGLTLGRRLSQQPLSSLQWPLGQPESLVGGVVGDLSREDHLIVHPKTKLHVQPSFGTKARISLVMGEPSLIHAKHYALLRFSYRRFFRVLTFNETLLARIPNGIFFPYGTTWVPDWESLDRTKTRHMSLIASAKRDTEGHQLRHRMVDHCRQSNLEVDILGRGYTPFETKSDGLAPYRFSIVIENMREENYFSEKLVDAVLCDTVPIYWGCPNLDRFMETRGVIQCANEAELWEKVQSVDEAVYAAHLPDLRVAQPQLAAFANWEKRAAEAIRDAL